MSSDTYVHSLPERVTHVEAPPRFPFPFHYRPHPLAVAAAEDLQQHLLGSKSWSFDFGLEESATGRKGKMFGVLVVENAEGQRGYLAAYSGKLADSNHLPGFVPPVYDLLVEDGFYRRGEAAIHALTLRIEAAKSDPAYRAALVALDLQRNRMEVRLAEERQKIKQGKRDRKRQRENAKQALSPEEFAALDAELSAQSIRDSYGLKDLKRALGHQVKLAEQIRAVYERKIERLEEERRGMSAALQERIFTEYAFLDAEGRSRGLGSIFSETVFGVPPAGAGECAAPKLLQFAYAHNLRPLAIAEFWWGQPPASEIRRHGQYYPACRGKCEPILSHMLRGLKVDPNPLLENPAENKTLTTVYEDDAILVIDKPAEFLSVPGRHIRDSVWARVSERFPDATGPLVVHRLDMSTSGLLVIAKQKEVHKKLQRQFARRSVTKRYQAIVAGTVNAEEGTIDLPLRGDLEDRPRQIVCTEHGRAACTRWKVVERRSGTTRVDLWPVTGRTHQLRVHCAHPHGLGLPICGDDLYGVPGKRLLLHAAELGFTHPVTGKAVNLQSSVPF